MKKGLLILITFLTFTSYSPIQAKTATKKDEQLRDEIIFNLLFPAINKIIEKYFGKPKQFYREQILQIKEMVDHKTHSYYNITVKLIAFQGHS